MPHSYFRSKAKQVPGSRPLIGDDLPTKVRIVSLDAIISRIVSGAAAS